MKKQKVYIETSFLSFLTSKPSRDLIIAAHQQITYDWWENKRNLFELFVSQFVYEEASKGNVDAAKRRIEIVAQLPLLELNEDVMRLANSLIRSNLMPYKFVADAFHISIATIHGMDYLLTWNCKHIANATIRYKIEKVCHENGYINPIICTPEELPGE